MLIKSEIAKDYNLTERGTIANPGKFEGEMWYVVALWDLVLNGGSDMETGEDPAVSWFRVDSNLTDLLVSESMTAADAGDTVGDFVAKYPVGSYFGLYEDSQGFVRIATSQTDPSVVESDCTCTSADPYECIRAQSGAIVADGDDSCGCPTCHNH